jgi:hypothetical protein
MAWYGGANKAKGQLSGTLAIDGTSFTMKAGLTFPATLANVIATIENEMVLGSYAAGTFSIATRAFGGTSAAAHAADTWVYVNQVWEHISELQTALGSKPTAENDMLVGAPTPFGAWVVKTLAQVKTILGLGTAAYTASGDYAVAAKGVTNGDSHDHAGGDGGQVDHGGLAGLSDDDHTQYLKLAGGTLTGDITLGELTAIALDPDASADEKWSGITVTGTAGATLAVGDLCYLNSSWKWALANASAASTAGSVALGICILAGNDTQATRMLLMGTMKSAAFPASITGGAQLYVSTTAGDMTTTQPASVDQVIRVVGWAILDEPNTIYFNPSSDFITRTA